MLTRGGGISYVQFLHVNVGCCRGIGRYTSAETEDWYGTTHMITCSQCRNAIDALYVIHYNPHLMNTSLSLFSIHKLISYKWMHTI